MSDKTDQKILSNRSFSEWTPSCPVQIKRIKVFRSNDEEKTAVLVYSAVCGDFEIDSYTADLIFLDERKQKIASISDVILLCGESDAVECVSDKTVFAEAIIKTVKFKNGDIWENTENILPVRLAEQEIFWQTDPLYDTVKSVCSGIVEPKYKPDEIDGAWRCACGQINLESSKKCGQCACSKEWLDSHLNTEYLQQHKDDVKKTDHKENKKKKASSGLSDKVKHF